MHLALTQANSWLLKLSIDIFVGIHFYLILKMEVYIHLEGMETN